MARWTRFGTLKPDDERPARQLVLVEAESIADLSDWQKLPSKHCLCLVIWETVPDERTLRSLVKRLLAAGAVHIAAFGPECESIEPLADELSGSRGLGDENAENDVIMTTSHAGESLDEALWLTLFSAFPAEAYEASTATALIVSIGAPQYSHALHHALGDPERFSERHLAAQPKSDHPVLCDVEVVRAADACWARDFACPPTALRPQRTHVQQHAGAMTGDRGIWMLVAGASPLVSLPPDLMPSLSELARSWTAADVLDPANLRWQVEERSRRPVERLVGPAFIGYVGLDGLVPSDPSSARPCADPATIEQLQRACAPLEWQHGGPHPGTVVQFAVEDAGGRLLALAGYEVWNETIAHLQVVTHPQHRGKGLGGCVVAAAAEHALDRGLFPQYRTLRSNAGAMAIARKLGFQDYGSSLYLV